MPQQYGWTPLLSMTPSELQAQPSAAFAAAAMTQKAWSVSQFQAAAGPAVSKQMLSKRAVQILACLSA